MLIYNVLTKRTLRKTRRREFGRKKLRRVGDLHNFAANQNKNSKPQTYLKRKNHTLKLKRIKAQTQKLYIYENNILNNEKRTHRIGI